MSILITGGTGFIGAHVARRLIAAGQNVVTLDSLPSNVINEVLRPEEVAQVSTTVGDVTSLRDVADVIQRHDVDRIIHLASMLHPACNEKPMLAIQVNLQGQATVLEAARLFSVTKVVWASSAVVFGNRNQHSDFPLANDAQHHPGNMYAATKSFAETLTNHYVDTWGVDALGLRLTVVYGPGRVRGASAFVNELVKPALGEPATVPFGDDIVDFQYVEDVARLLVTCTEVPKTKHTVLNTQFDRRSIREAGAYMEQLVPDAEISYLPGEFGVAWELDDSALQREIGFTPEFPMERGLRAVANYARRQAGLPPL